ncbi:helix-turn-helix domain-containing protein [[Ruminococcus] torques]|uniref:helix-turn-helix domain-containing protein n=2 Tax=[Ruminococcus] torques TaxID=33039 RepID=UPI0021092B98|nr:helix-turn-helix domain-containing protein [[Ruminococcus] torques]MCQ5334073.1 helix-turn-helix domain-containing protein [[Ruminococcus] torques]
MKVVYTDGGNGMDYASSAEMAKKWNVSQRRVAVFCKEGRVDGAILIGRMWMIPRDAIKPLDPRKIHKEDSDN